jgi:hypothetical protein
MVLQNIRPADLAGKLSVRPQEVTRLMNLNHATKIATLASAFNAMGKRWNCTAHEAHPIVLFILINTKMKPLIIGLRLLLTRSTKLT